MYATSRAMMRDRINSLRNANVYESQRYRHAVGTPLIEPAENGTVRAVKSRYPRDRVQVVFEGDDSFLRHPNVEEAKNYSGHAEIKLRSSNGVADAQPLLAEAVSRGTVITRFEVMEPTLEEIFIEKVRETGDQVDA